MMNAFMSVTMNTYNFTTKMHTDIYGVINIPMCT